MQRHRHLGIYGLIRHVDRVLLIRKARGPYRGQWDLPGGSPEFGETPLDTLIREVREETGLAVVKADLWHAWGRVVVDSTVSPPQEVHHLAIVYRVSVAAGEAKTDADGADSLGAQWFTREQVKALPLTPFAQAAIQGASHHGPRTPDH